MTSRIWSQGSSQRCKQNGKQSFARFIGVSLLRRARPLVVMLLMSIGRGGPVSIFDRLMTLSSPSPFTGVQVVDDAGVLLGCAPAATFATSPKSGRASLTS